MSTSQMFHSKLNTILISCIVAVVAISIYFNQVVLFTTPDWNHLQDYFAHSQWAIPFSTRSISDNQLYSVAALKLSQGMQPFLVNPEVPPLGKYLYSLGILVCNNPFTISLLLYLLIATLTGLIIHSYTKSTPKALLGACLLLLSPVFSSQIGVTMLELPLAFFLLLHVWSLLQYFSAKKASHARLYLVVAGIGLGGFAAVKFPLFVPILIISDLWLFWMKKKLRNYISVALTATATFLLSYIVYFLEGHTLIEWLRSFYWTVQFYTMGAQSHLFFQVVPALLFGRFQDTIHSSPSSIHEWTLLWPAVLFGYIMSIVALTKKQKDASKLQYFLVLIGLFLAVLCAVQFQARYLFPVLPIMLIVTIAHVQLRKILLVLFIGVLSFEYLFFWRGIPTETVRELERMWTNGHYQDLYSFVLPSSVSLDRRTFHEVLTRQINQNLSVQEQRIEVHFPPLGLWEQLTTDRVLGTVGVRLKTEFGEIERLHPVTFVRERNVWYLQWDWQVYMEHFDPTCTTSYTQRNTFGKLNVSKGIVLSEYGFVPYARLDTRNIPTTIPTFKAFADLLDIEDLRAENVIQNTANGREWLDLPIPFSKLPKEGNPLLERMSQRNKLIRTYNPQLTEDQQGAVKKIEEEHPELFHPAEVTINLVCESGSYTQTIPGSRTDITIPKF